MRLARDQASGPESSPRQRLPSMRTAAQEWFAHWRHADGPCQADRRAEWGHLGRNSTTHSLQPGSRDSWIATGATGKVGDKESQSL